MEGELAQLRDGGAEPVAGGLLVLVEEAGADERAGEPVCGGDRQAGAAGQVGDAEIRTVVVETVQQPEGPLDGLRTGGRTLDGGRLGHGTSRSVPVSLVAGRS